MSAIRKGYTFLEVLLCLCIISTMLLVSLRMSGKLHLEHYYYLNDYVLKQSEAILNRETVSYEKGVRFNSMGHVNQGRTIDFHHHQVIVHLGNGYATLE